MLSKRVIYSCSIIFILISCTFSGKIDENKMLKKAIYSLPYKVSKDNWKLIHKSKNNEYYYYVFNVEKNNMKEVIEIEYYPIEDYLFVDSYYKEEIQDSLKYFLFADKIDTLYYYVSLKDNIKSNKKFIRGEWCFRFNEGELTVDELEYYLENKDSLRFEEYKKLY